MSRWESFCVVGVGGHARTKLIPAILANGQQLAGVVSRQLPDTLPFGPVFATLDQALAKLPKNTAIVIATPPAVHHAQAKAAIEAGFDVIVEKPAFITLAEASDVVAACKSQGTILVEAFMQRHTGMYERFTTIWADRREEAVSLEMTFVIPALPTGTFRNGDDIAASALYDMGSYIVSLLNDVGLPVDDIRLTNVIQTATGEEAIELGGQLAGVRVKARIGVAEDYCNRVVAGFRDGSQISFEPFFYGRSGQKTIRQLDADEILNDGNAFETMFGVPREHWRATQSTRLAAIIAQTSALEALALQMRASGALTA